MIRSKKHIQALVAGLLIIEAILVVYLYSHQRFLVYNAVRPLLTKAEQSDFARKDSFLSNDVRSIFLHDMGSEIVNMPRGMDQLVQVRQWVRKMVPKVGLDQVSSADILTILASVEDGKEVICGDLTEIYVYAAKSLGYHVRLLQLGAELTPDTMNTHVTAEVWLDSRDKWVVMDPTFNAYFTDMQGKPLDAVEIRQSLLEGRSGDIQVRRDGSQTQPIVENYYMNPFFMFRHIFIQQKIVPSLPFDQVVSRLTLNITYGVVGEVVGDYYPFYVTNFLIPGFVAVILGIPLFEKRKCKRGAIASPKQLLPEGSGG